MRICRYVFVLMAVLAPFCGRALARQGPQERHGQIIPCSSDDGEKHYCTADTRYGARLVRQRSQAPCQEGGSWGYDEEGIWVDKGCGGEFTLGRGDRSEEHTSELQSQSNLVCRLLLEKKKNNKMSMTVEINVTTTSAILVKLTVRILPHPLPLFISFQVSPVVSTEEQRYDLPYHCNIL